MIGPFRFPLFFPRWRDFQILSCPRALLWLPELSTADSCFSGFLIGLPALSPSAIGFFTSPILLLIPRSPAL